jgi:CheY-like chemotaxis protein
MLFRQSDGPRVVVAHESEEISQQIGGVLLDVGFSPVRVPDGRRAWTVLEANPPAALVLDVALGQVMCFQLIDQIRHHAALGAVKVVLVASIFNKTAYKRTPATLHGADDYVEQHHIPDKLPEKLCRLLGLPPPRPAGGRAERVERIREGEGRADLAGERRIRALAHSIVSDIALYHEAELDIVLRTGSIAPLEAALDEGRRMLAERSNGKGSAGGDPVLEALNALLEDLRQAGE